MGRRSLDIRTRKGTPLDVLARVQDAGALFARASAYLPASPRFGSERGHRVFWTDRTELRFRDVVADPAGHVVVGRHSRAHIRVAGDPTVALRHFVLRARQAPDGVPELHVSDLLAPLPLYIDGSDRPHRACAVRGAFTARVGAHVLCALPFDGCAPLGPGGGPGRACRPDAPDDDEDPDPTHAREEDDDFDRSELALANKFAWIQARDVRRAEVSAKTLSSHIGVVASARADAPALVVELVGEARRATVAIPAADLDGLVIVGRYERCAAGADVFSEKVSRMHLAFTRAGDLVEVLDLASTNGLLVDGSRVHRALVGVGSVIALDDRERVRVLALP